MWDMTSLHSLVGANVFGENTAGTIEHPVKTLVSIGSQAGGADILLS